MTRRGWLSRGLLVVVIAVAVNVVLELVARRHDTVLVTLAAVCLVAAIGLVVDGASTVTATDWSVERLADVRPARTEATLAAYERLLERHWASRDVDTSLQRRLLALAKHRLAQSGAHPGGGSAERPDSPLGLDLAVLTDARPRRLRPAAISRVIDRIEEL